MKSDPMPCLSPAKFDPNAFANSVTLTRARWRIVALAFLGLLTYDILRLDHNFARLHRYVTWFPVAFRRAGSVNEISAAISYAAVFYPKRLRCLQRSAVMTCLLRRHGIAAKVVIGVQSLPFRAHAWTEVDAAAINERRDVQRIYQVIESC